MIDVAPDANAGFIRPLRAPDMRVAKGADVLHRAEADDFLDLKHSG